MMRCDKEGGELNLLRVLRHDLSDKPQPLVIYPARRVVVIVLAALAAVLTAIQIFPHY